MEKNLGHATAYGYAKSKGYTGTEEEFGVLMASYASVAQDASQSASSAAESAQLASNEAQRASQSATNAYNDAETASNIKTDVESARDTTVSAKNAAVEAKDISVEAKNSAISAKDTAESKAQIAEAWAVGQKDGTDVPSTDETYHNNAKYYSEQANTAKTDAESAQQLAQTSATNASESASEAAASAQTASQAAQTATDKASEASQSASVATNKASEASQSATSASQSASTATNKASEATTAAATATTKASEAAASATTASTAKINAETARDAAAQSSSEAAVSAIEAAQSAQSVDAERLNRVAFGSYVVEESTGSIASFTDGADSIPMKDVLVHIEPVQAGSGDPSPENVRPITGWTGAKVTRCGKNLLFNTVNSVSMNGITFTVNEDGSITVNGTATARANLFYQGALYLPPADYYLSIGKTFATGQCYLEVKLYKAATGSTRYVSTNARSGGPFTVEKGDYIQQIYFSVFDGKTVNDTIYPQIELGSTPTPYEPYQGDTYDITFPSEAGTVYGGTLDVTKGELVVDRVIWTGNTADMNNNEDYPGWRNAGIADIVGVGVTSGIPNAISNISPAFTSNKYAIAVNTRSATSTSTGTLFLTKDYFNKNQTEWKALALDIQVVLPLATPITYTLTPQEITSLLGTNNLWADTGDSEVEYRADTKLYIDNLTRSTEDDMTANANISKDAYFTIGNTLYKASVAISAGETIVPNTNCTIVSLADALNTLTALTGGN